MKKVLKKADKGIQIGKKKSTVSVTQGVDGKNVPFTGTLKENKRKAVMKVSNPDYGSTKTVEKFGRKGNLKSQTIFDRDASNKLSKITRNKVDKEGNIQSSVPYQSQKKGGATKALPKAGPGRIIKAAKAAIGKIKPKPKVYGESGQYSRLEDMKRSEAYRAGKSYKAPRNTTKDLVGMGGIGTALAAGIFANKGKKKTAKPTKPKQLGPQSFAKGGASKAAMRKKC